VVLVSTEEQHAAAVIARLNAGNAAAYDLDDLKALPAQPSIYTEVTVERRFGGDSSLGGTIARAGWRITTRTVAKTVSNAREMRNRARTQLVSARLTVDGKTTTPIRFESEDPIGDDDGWYSGLTTWTYAI
jgi:hypothetical protein